MNTKTFKNAGICFDFSRYAAVPEIPYVADVLYAMKLSKEQEYYDFSVNNHSTYVVNVGLVIVAIGYDVLSMERYDEAKARKIIAEAILELCPPRAKCLFNSSFVEAQEIFVGQPAPSKTTDAETLRQTCDCPGCKEKLRVPVSDIYGYGMED